MRSGRRTNRDKPVRGNAMASEVQEIAEGMS